MEVLPSQSPGERHLGRQACRRGALTGDLLRFPGRPAVRPGGSQGVYSAEGGKALRMKSSEGVVLKKDR